MFRGREDIFALRWEKGKKAGYRPEYNYDFFKYKAHKDAGGTFTNFKDKKPKPLNDKELGKHLRGTHFMGIYPLLRDDTSWFIAADFDKENWADECQTLIRACKEMGIPAYLERSRSGNGGHVWIFFEKPFPAGQSRRIMIHILQQTGLFSAFDKSSSYDRLFPNQDYRSGKGLGNLIALPLHGSSVQEGNTCFVNEQLQPFPDQWNFLASVRRVPASRWDEIYEGIQSTRIYQANDSEIGNLNIRLNNDVRMKRSAMPMELVNFLKKELNVINKDFIIRKKAGRSTARMVRYFRLIEESDGEVRIPRGFTGDLLRFCKQQDIRFEFRDERKKRKAVNFTTNLQLRTHQVRAVEATNTKDFGIISAPTASGKTVMALQIIANKKQPALIIVHRKQIMDQWMERIEAFLGIPQKDIGRMGQGRAKEGKRVTVAMIQSLGKQLEKDEKNKLACAFGTVIIDECHHIPAETFRQTILKLTPYYQYGFTATPFRSADDDRLLFVHLGSIIAEIKAQEIEEYKRARIVIRETDLHVPFNPKTDQIETLYKVLAHDTDRNRLIINDVQAELEKGRKAVILTERKEHIDTLYQYLKQSHEIICMSGDDPESARKSKWKRLREGRYQGLITTGQFFGEGSDLQNASCLFLVFPFSFKGKLIQYIGRVQRSEITPVIYDYRDRKIEYLNRRFLKRNQYYRSLERHATLFDESRQNKAPLPTSKIEKTIKVPIRDLDFRYGTISFKYLIPETTRELEFEVDNDEIRPEFDVLKPYFARLLKSGKVEIDISAEFEDELLVVQTARSEALERINREIIESVKFRFLERDIVNRQYQDGNTELIDIRTLQEGLDAEFYKSGENLLNDLLQNPKVKHYRQLRYLASRHERNTLKLRFVLHPFAFVFLIAGQEQYHIVLETLDTEEATYVWHFARNTQELSMNLKQIDHDLNVMRNQGRNTFLETKSANFTRLLHDYTDDRKGFVSWKARLEERLV
jgi:superfamily II DNA or RNA helicase